jgi:hypothetical protein
MDFVRNSRIAKGLAAKKRGNRVFTTTVLATAAAQKNNTESELRLTSGVWRFHAHQLSVVSCRLSANPARPCRRTATRHSRHCRPRGELSVVSCQLSVHTATRH